MSLALVVADTPINRIVVTSIVERAGLRVLACDSRNAASMLSDRQPGIVVFDAGSDNRACGDLLGSLLDKRSNSAKKLPLVIALSSPAGEVPSTFGPAAVDAVVAKPITPEGLQPVVSRLIEQASA